MNLPTFEVLPRDLTPYRAGNTGIDYVHRFQSGKPGPHVLINGITHGNEFCGMVAVCHLLDSGVHPKIGTLTLSLGNVAAYESFDPQRPFDSRQITHNLNRIWSAAQLDGGEDSVELSRARAMRPAVAAADHILDIHSTNQDVVPFWVYPAFDRNAAVVNALPRPDVHLVMPLGLGSGTPIIQGHFKLIDREVPSPAQPPRRFELLRTHVVKNAEFRFARPVIGFETFLKDELIATDGDEEIRSPLDDCTIFMPTRQPIVGREGVYLTRPMR